LGRAYEKAKPVIAKEENGVVPKFYIKILVEIEDLVKEAWDNTEARKSMSKVNGKSLSALRQKSKKYIRENFEAEMAKFRENPEEEEEEEEEEEKDKDDSDDEDDSSRNVRAASVPKERKVREKSTTAADDSDLSDEEWPSDSDSSSSSDDEQPTGGYTREMFLKKAVDPEEEIKKEKKKEEKLAKKQAEKEKRGREAQDDDDDEGWNVVDRTAAKIAMFAKDAEITHELVIKKLQEIVAARGKKKTNRKEQIDLLNELYTISVDNNLGPGMLVKIRFAIIASLFDYNPKLSDAMKVDSWEKCIEGVNTLLDLLKEHEDEITVGSLILDENEVLDQTPYKIKGCYLTSVERLDEEFVKVLKACDAHSNEYVERLKDEPRVVAVLDKAEKLVLKSGSPSEVCRIYLKRIEHIYFKFDPSVIEQKKALAADPSAPVTETSLQVMDTLCKFIYSKDSTDRLRTRAILCHIYHNAIHDNWYEARDLMLMSHLQETIQHSDPSTHILYNRTLVQLGLCGFRHGAIKDAHNALLDIQQGGRSKELIAQGLIPQRQYERSSEQEKIEKSRQIPFHMHINLELLECVYLVSAMLIEIPFMSAHEYDARRRLISKSYYMQLRNSERQALVGPPESMREHVVAASKAMRNGDWKKTRDLIINDKMNAKVWDLFYDADSVRTMLVQKIQEESLRTYLFTYSNVYDSISLPNLGDMFELEVNRVHALVSKMIINEELMASLDQPTQCIIMHKTDPSRLQCLALQLSDKIVQLMENNEKLLERGSGWSQRNWEGNRNNNREGGGNYRGGRDGGNFRGRGGGGRGSFQRGGFRQDRSQTYGKAWN